MFNDCAAALHAKKLDLALAQHQQGNLAAAQMLYDDILRADPKHSDALHLSGVLAANRRNAHKAVELIGEALKIDPANAPAHFNLATALQDLRRWESALASYDRAIGLDARFAAAFSNRGLVLKELGRSDAALASYDRAIAIQPFFPAAHFNRGSLLHDLKQSQAALASFDQAIAQQPHYAEAWLNRGNALRELGQFSAALQSYDRALALNADYALAHLNRGNALSELRQLPGALASYDRAIQLDPGMAEAHFNRSIAWLTCGDFTRGWRDYEWRWKNPNCANLTDHGNFRQPLWLGTTPVAGKTVLLHSEQGLGDTIQFCRYARLVEGLGARVILQVQTSLVGLLSGLEGVSRVRSGSDVPVEFDVHCPLMSLPLAFGTTLETIPAGGAYLRGDPGRVAHYQAKLGPRTAFRVGIAWCGSVENTNDRHRSIALAELIAGLPEGVQYVSLHKDLRDSDRQTLKANPDIKHLATEHDDFSDAAALSECLDLIVSVDTSLAHLGGALGKKTWVLLSANSDWRWLVERTDSPWYPAVRLYRQTRLRQWGDVLARVSEDLRSMRMESDPRETR